MQPIAPHLVTKPTLVPTGTHRASPAGRRPRRPADHDLAIRISDGATALYTELIARHSRAVTGYLDTCFADPHARDSTAERVFEDTLCTLAAGAEPRTCWRTHLLVTARVLVLRRWGAQPDDPALRPAFRAWADQGATWPMSLRPQLSEAYRRLPHPWQALLWHAVVEEDSPFRTARITGLATDGLDAALRRARTELRSTYLRAHHAPHRLHPDCEIYTRLLYAAVADEAPPGALRALTPHLETCVSCVMAYEDLTTLEHGLRAQLPPMLLGWWDDAAYRHSRDSAPLPQEPPAFLAAHAHRAADRLRQSRRRHLHRLAGRFCAGLGVTSLVASIGAAVLHTSLPHEDATAPPRSGSPAPSSAAVPDAPATDPSGTSSSSPATHTSAARQRPSGRPPTPSAEPSTAPRTTPDELAGYLLRPAAATHTQADDVGTLDGATPPGDNAALGNGGWLRFDNIDFGRTPPARVRLLLAGTGTGRLDLHVDSLTAPPAASVTTAPGGPGNDTYEAPVTDGPTGVHSVYVRAVCPASGPCATLRSLTFG
nr:carbohydrate-binding protein [Streptomyces sp. SID5785]